MNPISQPDAISLGFDVLYFVLVVFVATYATLLWRKGKNLEIRLFLIAFGVLSLNAAYSLAMQARKVLLGIPKPEPFHPIIDHFLATLFFLLLAYAILKPLLKGYETTLNLLFYNYLAFLVVLTLIIGFDYAIHWKNGMKFGMHWGDIVFESFQVVLMVVVVAALYRVWKSVKSRSTALIGLAFALWIVAHIDQLYNIVTTQNILLKWKLLEKIIETLALVLLGIGVVVPDEEKRTFMERYEAEVESIDTLRMRITDLKRHKEYVNNLADELRNPLQILRGYLELWDRESLSGEEKEYFEEILKGSKEIEKGIKKITEGEGTEKDTDSR